jgi:mono/diheme cytochrome c family protein
LALSRKRLKLRVQFMATRLVRMISLPVLAVVLATASGSLYAVEPEELQRGLITHFLDPNGKGAVGLYRVEPTIALAWQDSEAGHPRLRADGGKVVWQGHINLVRAGPYRFSARLRGSFRMLVASKEVLQAEVKDAQSQLKQGPEVMLEAGVHPITAELTRLPGPARVELLWKGPGFHEEPLPFDVVGHLPAQAPAQLKKDALVEQGRSLAEERSCVKCHQVDEAQKVVRTLGSRVGPDLSDVGQRLHPGWIERWLETPRRLRPGSVMPELFADDDLGKVERHAVASYLASLGGPVPASVPQKDFLARIVRGRALFTTTGCIACHGENIYPLSYQGSRTTAEQLARFLGDPLRIDPSGRMPNMLLKDTEARDLAWFLCSATDASIPPALSATPGREQLLAVFGRVDNRAEEKAAFAKFPVEQQVVDLGKRLVIDRGCNNCHTIAPGGKPFASTQANADFKDLEQPARHSKGCLADKKEQRGQAPWFVLAAPDRQALRAFLSEGLTGAGSPARSYSARLDLKRFNCQACHQRDGEGGLTSNTIEQMRQYEKVENAEMLTPPPLTGVGHKLRTAWLKQVLTGAGRARSWMGLRMPQFGAAHVGSLAEGLATLEGAEPDDSVHAVAMTPEKIEIGRHLAGKNAFGCIGCHDMAGNPNFGTRGPDLASSTQRVRYEWYRRWMEQPQRMQPGTKMPTVFLNGKSLLDSVLQGNADAQAEALWGYLALGNTLPLPAGIGPLQGLVLSVQDRPVVLRTFMPEAGSRAIAVGFPGGVSAAFDAHSARLAYFWTGNFLDVSPVWANRGGTPAKMLGHRLWTAPPGCPIGLSPDDRPPEFLKRAALPGYGGPVQEGPVFKGPWQVHFQGYDTDEKGIPTFRYLADGSSPRDAVVVRERLEPLINKGAQGISRLFTMSLPASKTLWLLAGTTSKEPRVLDRAARPQPMDWQSGRVEFSTGASLILLPQDGDRVTVLNVPAGVDGLSWRLEKKDGVWQVMLQLPRVEIGREIEVRLRVWVPFRDEPAFYKELAATR